MLKLILASAVAAVSAHSRAAGARGPARRAEARPRRFAAKFRGPVHALVALGLIVSAQVCRAAETVVQVETDQFEKNITLLGPMVGVNPFGGATIQWRIRSWVNKSTHVATHQLYVYVNYAGSWRNYQSASDEDAADLAVAEISKSVNSCSGAGSCTLDETVGVDLDDATLRQRASSGYRIKLKAQSGDSIVLTISPEQIAMQVAAVDKYIKDPASAALAVPMGDSPRDAEFGVDFSEPWGFTIRSDAKHFGLPDIHEALALSIKHGSIADKAGLRWADTIYEFDGQPIQSIQHLLELIRSTPAGKAVDFKVIHNGKSVTLHAQF